MKPMTPYQTNRKPWKASVASRRLALIAIVSLLCVTAMCVFAFRHLGLWLELDEPLRPSAAIVVLGGGVPFRAMEAAGLYHAGWAKEVWLTQGTVDKRDLAMAAIGFTLNAEYESSRAVLEKLGVPPAAIRIIPGQVDNTLSELRAILRYAQSHTSGAVILVSSKFHARRLRVIWGQVAGKRRTAIVRFTPADPFDADGWWRTTSDALVTFRETFGIVNAWAGFPIAPRER
jgi:uncharacterized SAM-binding protein YcdF (DUF218 family)